MEKAVLKTLVYADIFDYPLTVWELHKWLIGKKASLRQVEKALTSLQKQAKITSKNNAFFLTNRKGLLSKRVTNKKKSEKYFTQAQIIATVFKLIPWVKLVGVSGGLSMENPGKDGDIDLFVITAKNRLWLARFLMLILLSFTTLRRSAEDDAKTAAGKFCLNMILEEDKLAQQKKDLFIAHEVLQMKVLWERDNTYYQFLSDNEWVFKYLPNWIAPLSLPPAATVIPAGVEDARQGTGIHKTGSRIKFGMTTSKFIDLIENMLRRFQFWYMKKPQGSERIEEGAVYFHPYDYGLEVLNRFKSQIVKVSS